MVKPKFWNKSRFSFSSAAHEAMLQHAQKQKIGKINVSKLSTRLDKLNWLKVKGIMTNVFHNFSSELRFMANDNCNMPFLMGLKKGRKIEIQQPQEYDQSLRTVLSWFEKGNWPQRVVLQNQSRNTWVLWTNFDSFRIVNDNLCPSFEDSNTGQGHLKQVILTTLPTQILESIHKSATTAHLAVTKTLENAFNKIFSARTYHKCNCSCLKLSCLAAT